MTEQLMSLVTALAGMRGRLPGLDVFCEICGCRHDMDSVSVAWHGGNEWACADENACAERKAGARCLT